jgi:protein-histidine pros-kinase
VKLSRSGHNGTSEVNFAVIDTGPGISPENQKKLFDAFQRVGDTQSQIEGTGLGLYLSQKFADILGGKISLTSEPGHGSCFTLTLPGV